jgi:hypothetical protein
VHPPGWDWAVLFRGCTYQVEVDAGFGLFGLLLDGKDLIAHPGHLLCAKVTQACAQWDWPCYHNKKHKNV